MEAYIQRVTVSHEWSWVERDNGKKPAKWKRLSRRLDLLQWSSMLLLSAGIPVPLTFPARLWFGIFRGSSLLSFRSWFSGDNWTVGQFSPSYHLEIADSPPPLNSCPSLRYSTYKTPLITDSMSLTLTFTSFVFTLGIVLAWCWCAHPIYVLCAHHCCWCTHYSLLYTLSLSSAHKPFSFCALSTRVSVHSWHLIIQRSATHTLHLTYLFYYISFVRPFNLL